MLPRLFFHREMYCILHPNILSIGHLSDLTHFHLLYIVNLIPSNDTSNLNETSSIFEHSFVINAKALGKKRGDDRDLNAEWDDELLTLRMVASNDECKKEWVEDISRQLQDRDDVRDNSVFEDIQTSIELHSMQVAVTQSKILMPTVRFDSLLSSR